MNCLSTACVLSRHLEQKSIGRCWSNRPLAFAINLSQQVFCCFTDYRNVYMGYQPRVQQQIGSRLQNPRAFLLDLLLFIVVIIVIWWLLRRKSITFNIWKCFNKFFFKDSSLKYTFSLLSSSAHHMLLDSGARFSPLFFYAVNCENNCLALSTE